MPNNSFSTPNKICFLLIFYDNTFIIIVILITRTVLPFNNYFNCNIYFFLVFFRIQTLIFELPIRISIIICLLNVKLILKSHKKVKSYYQWNFQQSFVKTDKLKQLNNGKKLKTCRTAVNEQKMSLKRRGD